MLWARAAALHTALRLARATGSRVTLRQHAAAGHLRNPRTRTLQLHTWSTPRALKSTDVGYSSVLNFHRGASLAAMWPTQSAALSTHTGGDRTDGDKGEEKKLKETFATTSSQEKAPEHTEPEDRKPTQSQQLKKVFKEYGAVGVCFHIAMSLMSLGMFYALVSSGIDMAALLCKLGFSEAVVRSRMAAGTSTFVLAYAIHKLFAPVRISITLVSVPFIVRYFRKTGLFKPPTPTP